MQGYQLPTTHSDLDTERHIVVSRGFTEPEAIRSKVRVQKYFIKTVHNILF